MLEDNSVWNSSEPLTTDLWLPYTDVTLIDDEKMVNTDDDEIVEVRRIR